MLAKKCKKLVAMLLTLSLVLGLLGTAALASGTESTGGEPAPGAVTKNGVTVNKTATPLDENDKTTVSLSVGATEEKENVAVMFLLDKSTSQGMRDEAAAMLDELKTKTNTNILYDVVIFSGTATATGWRDIQNDADLEDTKANFVNAETTSGTNMTAGIQKAQSELAALPAGYDTTYLVTLSDGITYVWDEGGQTYCVAVAGLNAKGEAVESGVQAGPDTWIMLHPVDLYPHKDEDARTTVESLYGSFDGFLTNVESRMEATRQDGYVKAYGADGSYNKDSYVTTYIYQGWEEEQAEAEATYACGPEFALYYAATGYTELAAQFDKSFAYAVPELDDNGEENTANWKNYPWGQELMNYCQSKSTNAGYGSISNTDAKKIFSEIQDAILYAIQRGTVTDVIGDSFDLTDLDTVKLTVGGTELSGTADTENENLINFGTADEQGVYPYTVEYKPAADTEKEQLVWTINVPVESAAGVKLSYGLTLVNKAEDPGDYTVPTNESAVLDYTSTEGGTGNVTFPQPKLTYTVEDTQTDPDPDPEPPATDWEVSKSKTATNLDSSYESKVTLSLPSAQETLESDVVFVLDYSSCKESVARDALKMLENLRKQAEDSDAQINIGAVVYRGNASERQFSLQSLTKDSLDKLEEFLNVEPEEPGSNMHAGLLAAQAMLEKSPTSNNRQYMILISDGITYSWDQEGEQYAAAYQTETLQYANNTAWEVWHGSLNWTPSEGWDAYLDNQAGKIEKTLQDRSAPYDRKNIQNPIGPDERDTYASCVDVALYKCREVYRQLQSTYHCYAMLSGTDGQYGASFIEYLADGKTVNFKEIQNDIYYLLDAGSKVVDVIGYGDDYNFDFVNDINKLTLTVGGTPLDKVKINDTTYGFDPITDAETGETVYRYVLHYYTDGATDEQTGGNGQVNDECFVWEINVPVSNFAPVELTYSVKLTNPKTDAGTYGQYDADGSKGCGGLYTNNSAVLYPVDSLGNVGAAEEFGKPTVSYTVSGGGGGIIPSYNYYTVTVNYLDKETGEKVADSYVSPSRIQGSRYDVTAYDAIAVDGYTYDSTSGDALTGTLNSNKVVNVYYVAEATEIPDDDTPTGDLPEQPGETDIPDDDTPTGDLPEQPEEGNQPGEGGEVDIGDGETPTGNLPQTGTMANTTMSTVGMLLLAMSMATAGTAGIILLKRKEN